MPRPLEGIRVLDIGISTAGPYAARLLGDPGLRARLSAGALAEAERKQADGGVDIPAALLPYMGGLTKLTPAS